MVLMAGSCGGDKGVCVYVCEAKRRVEDIEAHVEHERT